MIIISAAAIKYYYEVNYYSQRDYKINNRTATNECLRYLQKESWEHIIQYLETKHMRVKFILELYKELKVN